MWLMVDYSPVALFSLRSSASTSSGGRANLCPTMYAANMSLVAAAFTAGQEGREVFELIKHSTVRFRPSRSAVVNNCFIRIQREPHDRGGVAFQPTVAYREFVFLEGDFTVAFETAGWSAAETDRIGRLLATVNYLGKRGGFVQFRGLLTATELGDDFSYVAGDSREALRPDVVVQFLDDFGPGVTFDAINSYSDRPSRLERDRIIVPVALPYRLRASSRGYTWYERAVS